MEKVSNTDVKMEHAIIKLPAVCNIVVEANKLHDGIFAIESLVMMDIQTDFSAGAREPRMCFVFVEAVYNRRKHNVGQDN